MKSGISAVRAGDVRRHSHFFGACLAFFLAGAASAETTLQGVSYQGATDQQSELTLTFAGPAPQLTTFTTDNPARLAIDLPDTAVGADVIKTQQFSQGIARSVRVVQAGARTRLVVGLDHVVPYEVKSEGNTARVILAAAGETGKTPVSMPKTVKAATAESRITNVDFRRGENGAGRITVTLTNPAVVIDLQTRGDKLVAEFADTRVGEALERRLDVTDFATPVKSVDTFNSDSNVKIVISPEGVYEHLAYQIGNTYTIDVKPPVKNDQAVINREKQYTGEKLSLNFQNIDVRAVLQLIGDFTGLNMVASDTVQGNITLRLKNVPWDQALEIILKSKGLGMRKNGNVILIAPSEELASREKLEMEAHQQVQELAPLRTEFFRINYAKAAAIAGLLKSENNSLLSKRGNVTIDERTNTLMISDVGEKLDEIRAVIEKLDIPVRQVLIESRIVIATDKFSRDVGARFGYTKITPNGPNGIGTTSGTLSGTNTSTSSAMTNLASATNGTPYPVDVSSNVADRLNVDLGVTNPAGSIALAVLGSDYLVDLELSAMQAEGKGEVLSSPRVVTANQKEAKIEQGVEIPYLQASSSGATTVAFKKAVLSLAVTPQITPDERVIMDLKVNKDSVGQVFVGVPSINTRNVDTQVLVNNGSTVVLGGIYEQTRSDEIDKVPVLGDLPLIGALFRQTRKIDDKAELLIFVTPKILREGLSAGFK